MFISISIKLSKLFNIGIILLPKLFSSLLSKPKAAGKSELWGGICLRRSGMSTSSTITLLESMEEGYYVPLLTDAHSMSFAKRKAAERELDMEVAGTLSKTNTMVATYMILYIEYRYCL